MIVRKKSQADILALHGVEPILFSGLGHGAGVGARQAEEEARLRGSLYPCADLRVVN